MKEANQTLFIFSAGFTSSFHLGPVRYSRFIFISSVENQKITNLTRPTPAPNSSVLCFVFSCTLLRFPGIVDFFGTAMVVRNDFFFEENETDKELGV